MRIVSQAIAPMYHSSKSQHQYRDKEREEHATEELKRSHSDIMDIESPHLSDEGEMDDQLKTVQTAYSSLRVDGKDQRMDSIPTSPASPSRNPNSTAPMMGRTPSHSSTASSPSNQFTYKPMATTLYDKSPSPSPSGPALDMTLLPLPHRPRQVPRPNNDSPGSSTHSLSHTRAKSSGDFSLKFLLSDEKSPENNRPKSSSHISHPPSVEYGHPREPSPEVHSPRLAPSSGPITAPLHHTAYSPMSRRPGPYTHHAKSMSLPQNIFYNNVNKDRMRSVSNTPVAMVPPRHISPPSVATTHVRLAQRVPEPHHVRNASSGSLRYSDYDLPQDDKVRYQEFTQQPHPTPTPPPPAYYQAPPQQQPTSPYYPIAVPATSAHARHKSMDFVATGRTTSPMYSHSPSASMSSQPMPPTVTSKPNTSPVAAQATFSYRPLSGHARSFSTSVLPNPGTLATGHPTLRPATSHELLEDDISPDAKDKWAIPDEDDSDPRGVYRCPVETCAKMFTRRYNLLSHMRVHSGERPFPCRLCNAEFSRKHDLRRHIRSLHSEERPHQCAYCNLSFARSDALKRHLASEAKRGNGTHPPLEPEIKGHRRTQSTSAALKTQ